MKVDFEEIFLKAIHKTIAPIINDTLRKPIQRTIDDLLKEILADRKGNARYLSKESAADILDTSISYLDSLTQRGRLKKYYLDGKNTIRFKENDILALLKDQPDKVAEYHMRAKRIIKKGVRKMKKQ